MWGGSFSHASTGEEETCRFLGLAGQPAWPAWHLWVIFKQQGLRNDTQDCLPASTYEHTHAPAHTWTCTNRYTNTYVCTKNWAHRDGCAKTIAPVTSTHHQHWSRQCDLGPKLLKSRGDIRTKHCSSAHHIPCFFQPKFRCKCHHCEGGLPHSPKDTLSH